MSRDYRSGEEATRRGAATLINNMGTPADAWSRTVYSVVKRVPPGRVATYGLVAMVAGRPLAARAVGNVMRACDDPRVPCHRVVRASGLPAFARHRALLRREGVHF